MLTRLEQAQQKWGGELNVVDHWLEQRQQLLVEYCRLAGLPPFERSGRALPEVSQIRQFCERLVDYLSAGHFEIYDRVVSSCAKCGPEGNALAQKLYPQISDTTEEALAFHDQYAEVKPDDALQAFDTDLANLGETMEARFEMEDQLINLLHSYHKQATQQAT